MNTEVFWELIDRTRHASNNDFSRQTELIADELVQLSEQELLECEGVFDDLMREAYLPDLWEVAYIISNGCSDDGFMDFRDWLICQGKNIYQVALEDPEGLVDTIEIGRWLAEQDVVGNKGMWPALCDAWKGKGKDIGTVPRKPKPHLQLKRRLRNESAMLAAFPKAAARYWQRS